MSDIKYCSVPPCTHTNDKIAFVGDRCTICEALINHEREDTSHYDQVVVSISMTITVGVLTSHLSIRKLLMLSIVTT